MKKILFYSLLLFWWCLMFPSNSYTANYDYKDSNLNANYITINDKEIRLKFLDFLFEI